MSRLSQRQAARSWKVSRATIQRAIKAGKLTPDIDGKVDAADMLRVFGEPHEPAQSHTKEPPGTTPEPPGKSAGFEAEIARLKAELETMTVDRDRLRELVTAKDETIAAMRLLTHQEPPKRRRWWQW